MDDNAYKELGEEIKGYKSRKEYAECVKRMEEREQETTDPEFRAIVLMAKATCSAQMGDFASAENAAFAIDMGPLSPEMRNYVKLTKASISRLTGQLERGEVLFREILASEEAHSEEQRDVLYEASARLGIAYAHKNRFAAALDLLQQASILMPDGDLHDDIGLYLGYCLQALGRLDEAEEILKPLLENGLRELAADIYYRLGAVQLQARDCDAAIDSFQRALGSLTGDEALRADIVAGLRKAKEQQSIDPADRPPTGKRPRPRVQ